MAPNNTLLNFTPDPSTDLVDDPLGGGQPQLQQEETERMRLLLRRAKRWWDEREDFRRRRARNRDFRRGRQWQRTVENDKDESVTEEQYIKEQGRIPWVINQVASVVRNLKGQYRQNESDRAVFAVDRENSQATEQMNVKRRGTRRWNRASMVEADQFEEHIMSGASAFKATFDFQDDLDRPEVEIDPVDQTRLFYNLDLDDRRLKNLRIIGELHDLTREELLATYAVDENGNFSRQKADALRSVYGTIDDMGVHEFVESGFSQTDSLGFYTTESRGMVRVIEVWTKKHKIARFLRDRMRGSRAPMPEAMDETQVQQMNDQRADQGLPPVEVETEVVETWMVYHLSPRGDVLMARETPYWHQRHPYVLNLATLVDGETWGLIEQVIDPQRWLNRIVVMIDHAMGVGAKGVLLVPEQTIPDDMNIEDFADTWSKTGGVLKIKLKPGVEPPREIVTNSIKPGSFELLQQLKGWIEEVSGVTGAQMGQQPPSDTPASLFQQQIIQSGITNLDYFESFFEGVRELDYKTVQLLQQAIDRPITLSEGATQRPVEYRPEDVRELKFDVSIGSVKDTATFRQVFEEDLRNFLESGFIDFGTFLQMSSHPKADTLLRVLQQRDPSVLDMGTTELTAAAEQLAGGDQDPEALAQALQGARGDGAPGPNGGPPTPSR